jgi:hypothetical protein
MTGLQRDCHCSCTVTVEQLTVTFWPCQPEHNLNRVYKFKFPCPDAVYLLYYWVNKLAWWCTNLNEAIFVFLLMKCKLSCLHWLGCACVLDYNLWIVLFCIGYERRRAWGGSFALFAQAGGPGGAAVRNHQFGYWLMNQTNQTNWFLRKKWGACSRSEGRSWTRRNRT